MKKLFINLLFFLAALCAGAQPVLVGHRGSGYGLENSEESFRKGIELGYKYLETDVKFTKDNVLVCSHDDDTRRLGGTKDLATSTLDELQSETLSQTRSGVNYTGRLCSMKEYLQICKEGNVGPLIELKWTGGINSNDQSKIPLLIAAIEAEGMRDKCIILTSMKPCLEYIRTNYPDIKLQFLTGQYWENHFDWCVQWNIDVDIQAGYFDKSTVTRYHDKGLKVNMWTTNDEAGYKSYGNMGCDYITTDRLDGHNLPELNPDILLPHNTVDYPNSPFSPAIKGAYKVEPDASYAWPAEFGQLNVRRAVSDRQGGWYVLLHDAEAVPSLFHLSGKGEPKLVSLEGVEGGMVALNDIAVTADGKLIGCNLDVVSNNAETTKPWKTYLWDSAEASPVPFISTDDFAQAGNWINGLIGNSFAVSGRLAELKMYTTSRSTSGSTYRVCGYEVAGGVLKNAVYALGTDYTADNWGDFSLKVAPRSQNNIIVAAPGKTAREYTFEWGGTRLPMTFCSDFGVPEGSRAVGASFMRYGAKVYTLVPDGDAAITGAVYDVTAGLGQPLAACEAFDVCSGAGAFVATAMQCGAKESATFTFFVEGQGLYSYVFDPAEETPAPADLGLKLERKWIRSNTTGNEPEHIDGTNAQQGTAVNGIFYVNDCVDKRIYIFDETGCIGSVDGGAGWGCARDDAGNIIVRDDKNTDETHAFIIYPAGLMPDNAATPVRLEIKTPLDGQVNFINASGDVLGNDGIIYLYPSRQSAVALLYFRNGGCVATSVTDELSFAGSTAGYVAPMGNDRENWIYQVRNTNTNFYRGGVNTNVLPGRASTTAPARNSTGGCAYYKEGVNELFVHNSGANYVGGFTVRDLSMNTVIATVEPIGEKAYVDGGNRSTFNWLILEPKGECDYNLYQYCPANGMAMYRLYNPSLVSVDKVEAAEGIVLSHRTAVARGAESISVYNTSGILVMRVNGDCADLSELPAGIYIIRTADGRTLKAAL